MTPHKRTLVAVTCLTIILSILVSAPAAFVRSGAAAAKGYSAAGTPELPPLLRAVAKVLPSAAGDGLWTADGNQDFADFAVCVSTAGDVNGDGFDDVIIGEDNYTDGSHVLGRACVYHGSASGLPASPNWTAVPDEENSMFGMCVSTAGDVNGDGYDDVIIGAPIGSIAKGRAYVYYGSASGLSDSPDWTYEGPAMMSALGMCVATAGDVNSDGYSDVIVGAPMYTNDQTFEGRAYFFYGHAAGLDTVAGRIFEGNLDYGMLGVSVGTAGDVDGDGYDDVIVGQPRLPMEEPYSAGRACIIRGSAAGLQNTVSWTRQGAQGGAMFGICVGAAGDVNSDSYSDVIIGEPGYTNGQPGEGRVCIYYGSASGPSTSPDWTFEGDQVDCGLGGCGNAGDVNGDGYDDIMAGTPEYSNGQPGEGGILVCYGSADGPSAMPDWTAEGNQDDAGFGSSGGTAGDINNDGYHDIIVGAPGYDNGQEDEGRAYVYCGSESGLVNLPPVATNDDYDVDEDSTLDVPAPGMLGNDADNQPESPSAILVANPSHGIVTLDADGSFSYSPEADFSGADSFTYKANDGELESNIATVTITVNPINDAPVADNDTYDAVRDTVLSVASPGVLANDTDVDGDPVTPVLVSNASHGTLALTASGSFTYTPAAGYTGTDSFTYKANDGTVDSDAATVTITVEPPNSAPATSDDTYSVNEDNALNIAASTGVLANDTDADGDNLTATLVGNVSHGSLTLNSVGSFTYTPAANWSGTDSFTYKVNDGKVDSNVATVAITVIPLPDITSIDITEVHTGKTLTVAISGNDFSGVTKVSFGSRVSTNRFTVDSPTQITAEITVASDAEIGARDLTITAPTGTQTMANALTVEKAPSKGIAAWVWVMVGLGAFGIAGATGFVIWRIRRARSYTEIAD